MLPYQLFIYTIFFKVKVEYGRQAAQNEWCILIMKFENTSTS